MSPGSPLFIHPAMVARRAIDLFKAPAKERQQVRKGKQPGASPVNLPELSKGDARDQAGQALAPQRNKSTTRRKTDLPKRIRA